METELRLRALAEQLKNDVVMAYDTRFGYWVLRRPSVPGSQVATGRNLAELARKACERLNVRCEAGAAHRCDRFG